MNLLRRARTSLRSASVVITAIAAILLGSSAGAHASFYFTLDFDGTQTVPPSGSPAAGSGVMVYDFQTYEFRYNFTITGLQGTETSATINGYAAPGETAPVLYTLPLGAHKVGLIQGSFNDLTQWVNGSRAYVNIVTSAAPAGEIRAQIVFPTQPFETYFCTGEGAAACPCGNQSSAGTFSGCKHSLGYGAVLRCHNIWSYSIDTLKVHLLTAPTTTPVLFFHGTTQINGGMGLPFGDGLRCVGGTVRRLATKTTTNGTVFYPDVGEIPITTKVNVPGPGYVSHFQAWYRNADATFCTTATYNLTNGTSITWVP